MESDEVREALREADRAEAAPWTDYPPTPWWYPLATGVWAAALVLAIAELDPATPALLGLVAIELLFVRWYFRYRGGVMPSGPAPHEFRRAIRILLGVIVLVILAAYVLTTLVGTWAGAAVALIGVTADVGWYERAYAEAARRTRERLG
jgi:hypothetical protein